MTCTYTPQSVYFAIDYVDFKSDARDDKNEFHGTGIVVYHSVKNSKGNIFNLNIKLETFCDQRSYKSFTITQPSHLFTTYYQKPHL